MYDATLNPSTSQNRRKATGPVIAAVGSCTGTPDHTLTDARRPTHLTRPDNQRVVEHSTFLQVVEQGAEGPIRHGTKPGFQINEIATVSIPIDADVGDSIIGPEDRDKRNSGFNQSPCLQDRLTVDIHPIPLANSRWLARQVECLDRTFRGQQRKRSVIVTATGGDANIIFEMTQLLIDRTEQMAPPVGPRFRNIGLEIKIAHFVTGQAPIGIDSHRIKRRPKPAGSLSVRRFHESRCSIWHNGHHRNMRRQRTPSETQPRNHSSDPRPILR